jgi:hypothetical protein
MSGLPSPEDIAIKILVWLSAPAVIVTILPVFSPQPDGSLSDGRAPAL